MAIVATETDRDVVLETIVSAFDADPLWSWMYPDASRRAEQHATIFGLYVDSALPRGGVWMSDERASAAAVFTHPGQPELSEEAEARLEPFVREALGSHAQAVLETMHRFEAAIPQGRTFYYLSLLGTRADSRGKGVGMGLLAELTGSLPTGRASRPISSPATRATTAATSASASRHTAPSRHPTSCTP